MIRIQEAAMAFSRATVPADERPGLSKRTSGALVARAIDPDRISANVAILEGGLEGALVGDDFAVLAAKWMLYQGVRDAYPAIFAASTGSDDMAKAIHDTFESKANLVEIHKDASFTTVIEPMHTTMEGFDNTIRGVKTKIAERTPINVVPLATPQKWRKAVEALVAIHHMVDEDDKLEGVETLLAHNVSKVHVGADVLTLVKQVAEVFSKLPATAWTALVREQMTGSLSKKGRADAAMLGQLPTSISYMEVVNRFDSYSHEIVNLLHHTAASSLKTQQHLMLDFSLMGSASAGASGEEMAVSKDFNKAIAEASGAVAHSIQNQDMEESLAPLILHILNAAGAKIYVQGVADQHRPLTWLPLAVPVEYHPCASVIKLLMRNSWKAFTAKPVQFSWVEVLARTARSTHGFKKVEEVRKDVREAVKEDLEAIFKAVKAASATGTNAIFEAKDGADAMFQAATKKLVPYQRKHVVAEEDNLLTIADSAATFVATGLNIVGTRPLGEVKVPVQLSAGMSEGVLIRDKYAFNRVETSVTMEQIAGMFNHASTFTEVKATSLNLSWSAAGMWAQIAADVSNGQIRVSDRKAETLTVTDVAPDAKFTDRYSYYVQIVDQREGELLFASGLGLSSYKRNVLGSRSSSFQYGVTTPAVDATPAYARANNELLSAVMDNILNAYALHAVNPVQPEDIKVGLAEENRSYVRRLPTIRNFVPEVVDVAFALTALANIGTGERIASCFDSAVISRAGSHSLQIRPDAKAVIDMAISAFANEYLQDLSDDVKDIIRALVSQSATANIMSELRKPAKKDKVQSVMNALADFISIIPREAGEFRLYILREFINMV